MFKKISTLALFVNIFYSVISQTILPSDFTTNGTVNVITQDEKNIYVGGQFDSVGFGTHGIVKSNSDFKIDTRFPSLGGTGNVIISDGKGGWFVGGSFTDLKGIDRLVHIKHDYSIDGSFKPNPNGEVESLILVGNTLYIAGSFTKIASESRAYLAAIDIQTGNLMSWNPNPNGVVNQILHSGTNIYARGKFTRIGGINNQHVSILDAATGTAKYGVSPISEIASFDVDNKDIYVGGWFNENIGYKADYIALFNGQTELPDGSFFVFPVPVSCIIPDGRGGWYVYGSNNVERKWVFSRIKSDYTIDSSFVPPLLQGINCLLLDDNKLYVGGSLGSMNDNLIALNPETGQQLPWNAGANGKVNVLMKGEQGLYVGGEFTAIGGGFNRSFAILDPLTGKLKPSISSNKAINAVAEDSSNIYLGGTFTGETGYVTGRSAAFSNGSALPDMSFPHTTWRVNKVILDGKGGWFVGGNGLIRVKSNYELDSSFINSKYFDVTALYLDGDNLYVASNLKLHVWDLKANTTFELPYQFNGVISNIFSAGDTLYATGSFKKINEREQRGIVALNKNTYNMLPAVSILSWVRAVDMDDKNIYLGSYESAVGINTGKVIWTDTENDFPDLTMPFLGEKYITKIVSDGKNGWYIGYGNEIIRVDANKKIDPNFKVTINNNVFDILLDNDLLYIAGNFNLVNSTTRRAFAVLNANTGVLQPLNLNMLNNEQVLTIKKVGDRLFLGGAFTSVLGTSVKNFAVLDLTNTQLVNFPHQVDGSVSKLETFNNQLYLSGAFSNIGSHARKFFGSVSLSNFEVSTLDLNVDGGVYDFKFDNNILYICGEFSKVKNIDRKFVAAINLSTSNLTNWQVTPDKLVKGIGITGDKVVLVGSFNQINEQVRNYAAIVSKQTGVLSTWDLELNNTVNTVFVNNGKIVLGGDYTNSKIRTAGKIVVLDRKTGLAKAFNPNINGEIYSLIAKGNKLYVGGKIHTTYMLSRNFTLAEIDLTTAEVTPLDDYVFQNPLVNDMYLSNDNTLYFVGKFSEIKGVPRQNGGAINLNTKTLTSWNPNFNDIANTICGTPNRIIVGGDYFYTNTEYRKFLFSISKTTKRVTDWDAGVDGYVTSIISDDASLYVGGVFSNIGGKQQAIFGEFNKATNTLTSWNPQLNGGIYVMRLQNEKLYVGGEFTQIGVTEHLRAACLNIQNKSVFSWNPAVDNSVLTIALNNEKILLGGQFRRTRSDNRVNIYSSNIQNGELNSWKLPATSQEIFMVKKYDDNLYISGLQIKYGTKSINLGSINTRTNTFTTWSPPQGYYSRDLYKDGDRIYLYNGTLVAVDAVTGALIESWKPTKVPTKGLFVDKNGLICVGSFKFSEAQARKNIFAISKKDWRITYWNPSTNGIVYDIKTDGNYAYIGGDFTTVKGKEQKYITKVNLDSGTVMTWNPNPNRAVRSIDFYKNQVVFGGNFTDLNRVNTGTLAFYSKDTDVILNNNFKITEVVNKVLVNKDILFVGGNFGSVNGISNTRARLAAIDLDKNELLPLTLRFPSGNVNDLAVIGNTLYVAGDFRINNPLVRNNIASLNLNNNEFRNWNPKILQGGATTNIISDIYLNGDYAFIGGRFNSVNDMNASNFTILDVKTGLPKLYFPTINNQTNTIITHGDLMVLGGQMTKIDGHPVRGLSVISLTDYYSPPSLIEVVPNTIGNGGVSTVSIIGNGFFNNLLVKLVRPGFDDIIIPDSLLFAEYNDVLKARVDLSKIDVENGWWDLEVEIVGDTIMLLENAINIEAKIEPVIDMNLIGFREIRPDTWQTYSLTMTNAGNTDAIGLPVYIVVDENVELEFSRKVLSGNSSHQYINIDTTISVIKVDTLFGNPYAGKVYMLILSDLGVGVTDVIDFRIKTTSVSPFNIRIWNDSYLFQSEMNQSLKTCLASIIDILPDDKEECIVNQVESTLKEVVNFSRFDLDNKFLIPNSANGKSLTDYLWIFKKALDACSVENSMQKSKDILKALLNYAKLSESVEEICHNIVVTDLPEPIVITPINSLDPNDKQGPLGKGSDRFIAGRSVNVPYVIRFENVDTAAAAAQVVEVVDTLDMNVFDLSTFSLGAIQVSQRYIDVPYGLKEFNTDVDLRPEMDLILRVDASLNMSNGVVRWLFSSLDPKTLKATLNPTAGFLSPNVNSPEGEGAVLFTIKTKNNLQLGTLVKNSANIFFDKNEPILTNTWNNKVDNIKPTSSVLPIYYPSLGDTVVTINWKGADVGVGVKHYTVFYSVNGGEYQILVANTKDTSIVFSGEMDSTYSFYSIATDLVGNVESIKTNWEASVTFGKGIPTIINENNSLTVKIFPNPNNGSFNLLVNTKLSGELMLLVSDVTGRVLVDKKHIIRSGEQYITLNIEKSGIYFITVENKGNVEVVRVVVTK